MDMNEDHMKDIVDSIEVITDHVLEVKSKVDTIEGNYVSKDQLQVIQGEKGATGDVGPAGKDGARGPMGPQGMKGDTGPMGIMGPQGAPGEDGSPDSAESIRAKIESLKGDERVDLSAIRGSENLATKKDLEKASNKKSGGLSVASFAGVSDTTGISSVTTDSSLIGTGTSLDPLGLAPLLTDQTSILGDGVSTPLQAVSNQTGKGLLKGGAVWTGTGFIFDVSELYYYIDDTFYSSLQTQVTLAASDPTLNRFDVIVVDDTGTVSVITGTPAANPDIPSVAWNQVVVSIILVAAASTTPTTISYDLMYNEDAGSPTEWVASTYSLASPLGTVNSASTSSPYNGAKCIQATAVNIRRGALLTRGTDVNIQSYSSIQFAFRLANSVSTSQNFNIRFRNSSGTFIGNTVNIFNWGASRTVTGTWQLVVIPITAFGNITNVRSWVGIMAGGNTSATYNWSLDFIKLADSILPQSNLGPIYLSPSNTLYSSGAAQGATTTTNSIFFGPNAGYKAPNALSSTFLGKNAGYDATNSDNSNFIGENAGYGANTAGDSNFLGSSSGYQAFNATRSNFFGTNAGYQALDATRANIFGYQAAYQAYGTYNSNIFGYQAGYQAYDAHDSNFLGYEAGYGADTAANALFIGYRAGKNDTVDTTGSTDDFAILIGQNTSTGGFKNSMAIGSGATNTAQNQAIFGSSTRPLDDFRIIGTGAFMPQVGTTAERPATPVAGMIRFNTTTSKHEGYDGSTWNNLY